MLKPGDTFERYTVEAAIGQGGMGCVYRAHDTRLGRRVALKVISDGLASADADARLVREARAAAALDHPNAVAIFDVGEVAGAPYIVMEFVEGRTLRGEIGDAEVPLSKKIAWLADVARALAAAHRRGLVHRDVKPENVMVRSDGVVKVLDFGIARRAGGRVDPHGPTRPTAQETPTLPTLTVEGVRLGTPLYMSPEQIRGEELDGRADQFAWGVLAYELLSGRLPWRRANDALAAVASILTDEVKGAALDEARVPLEVQSVLQRTLAKPPADRFATMDDVVHALEAAVKGEAPPPPKASPPERAPLPSATTAQRYSTEEVREVLARAIDQQGKGSSKLGFNELLEAAKEVGVDEESLREASRALRAREEERALVVERDAESDAERDAWIRRKRRGFHRHAGVYLLVNMAMLVLGLLTEAFPWTMIPGLFWAIGLGIHGLVVLTTHPDDWNEERKRMRWWIERQQRKHEVAMARAGEKADRKLKRVEAVGKRFDAPPDPGELAKRALDPAQAKLRVTEGASAERERAAEEEAERAERREERRRRR